MNYDLPIHYIDISSILVSLKSRVFRFWKLLISQIVSIVLLVI